MSKIIIALYIITTSLALVVLKLGSKAGAPIDFINGKVQFNLTPYTIVGVVLYGVSFATYTYLISKYDLGYIIPLTAAFIYVAIFVASFFIFQETFNITKILGIGFIITGLTFLNLKK